MFESLLSLRYRSSTNCCAVSPLRTIRSARYKSDTLDSQEDAPFPPVIRGFGRAVLCCRTALQRRGDCGHCRVWYALPGHPGRFARQYQDGPCSVNRQPGLSAAFAEAAAAATSESGVSIELRFVCNSFPASFIPTTRRRVRFICCLTRLALFHRTQS